jgi:hypothetical protein
VAVTEEGVAVLEESLRESGLPEGLCQSFGRLTVRGDGPLIKVV